jgi:transcriptional regulator with XRE-family HTH domain
MSETVGERLRRQRVEQGRTQRSVAAEVGIGFPYLCKLEKDLHTPSDDVLSRLAEVLGENADELTVVAGRIPPWAACAFAEDPAAAVHALREFLYRPR